MSMLEKKWTVESDEEKGIVDYLYSCLKIPRGIVRNAVKNNLIGINGKVASIDAIVHKGDFIDCIIPESRPRTDAPEDIPLDVVYEDEDIMIINKEKGVACHPAPGNYTHTLLNALLFRFPTQKEGKQPRLMHRLDMLTSGLVTVGKNEAACKSIGKQLATHACRRIYTALACGVIEQDEGTIDAPIGRDPDNFRRMGVTDIDSKRAVTHFKVIERFKDATLVQLELETGRTHQIRVHMAYIGHPLVNDGTYGTLVEGIGFNGQALHASCLMLTHPSTGQEMTFTAPLPEYMEKLIEEKRSEATQAAC